SVPPNNKNILHCFASLTLCLFKPPNQVIANTYPQNVEGACHMTIAPRKLLEDMFNAAIKAAQPERCIPPFLPNPPKGRTIVIGAGKASAEMARALEANWNGPLEGTVVTRYGHSVPCEHITIIEAAHPVPDDAGLQASKTLL